MQKSPEHVPEVQAIKTSPAVVSKLRYRFPQHFSRVPLFLSMLVL